jgi:FtsZ-binding cell division protein ZapB
MIEELITTQREIINSQNEYIVLLKEHNESNENIISYLKRLNELLEQEVNLLKHDQQHWGNTFQVIGSRLGFIVGGGAVLWCLDWLTWQPTFLLLATIVFLNTLPIWLFKEPHHTSHASRELKLNQLNLVLKIKAYLRYFSQNKVRNCGIISIKLELRFGKIFLSNLINYF